MGRNPIKENQNPYFRARKQAAEWDARLESRERASELIGIAAYTLADYELGNVKRVPADKVLIMADLYNAPWLLSNYCKNECPICGFLPLATEEKNICSVTVRLLKALREDELENMKNQLLEISQDNHARKYSQAYRYDLNKGKKSSKWTTDFEAMALKTVIKLLLSKWGILSVDMQRAIQDDQKTYDEEGNGTYGDNKPDSVPELEAQDPFEVVEEEPEDVDIDAM